MSIKDHAMLVSLTVGKAQMTKTDGKATTAAEFSAKVAEGSATQAELDAAIASEWQALAVVLALTVANVILGVWRPAMRGRAVY